MYIYINSIRYPGPGVPVDAKQCCLATISEDPCPCSWNQFCRYGHADCEEGSYTHPWHMHLALVQGGAMGIQRHVQCTLWLEYREVHWGCNGDEHWRVGGEVGGQCSAIGAISTKSTAKCIVHWSAMGCSGSPAGCNVESACCAGRKNLVTVLLLS